MCFAQIGNNLLVSKCPLCSQTMLMSSNVFVCLSPSRGFVDLPANLLYLHPAASFVDPSSFLIPTHPHRHRRPIDLTMASYPLSLGVTESVSVPFPKVRGLFSAFVHALGFGKRSDKDKTNDKGDRRAVNNAVSKRRRRRRGGARINFKGYNTERRKR